MSEEDLSELSGEDEQPDAHLAVAKKSEKSANRKAKARQQLRERFMANLMATRDGRE